jgi:hypothetical protein
MKPKVKYWNICAWAITEVRLSCKFCGKLTD